MRLGYDSRVVVDGVTLAVPTGKTTAVVGPNGCGKSTLLRGLGRLLRPRGRGAPRRPRHRRAAHQARSPAALGLLPQQPIVPEGISVLELVERGRHPHLGLFRTWSRDDEAAVAAALERTDLVHLAGVPVDSLSGGQRQRAWIAMALAQATPVLLLDEPTSFLDIAHQLDVLDLVRGLVRRLGHHRRHGPARPRHGRPLRRPPRRHARRPDRRRGHPAEIVTPEVIEAVFGIAATRRSPTRPPGTPSSSPPQEAEKPDREGHQGRPQPLCRRTARRPRSSR